MNSAVYVYDPDGRETEDFGMIQKTLRPSSPTVKPLGGGHTVFSRKTFGSGHGQLSFF
jgi:hypothetical protein